MILRKKLTVLDKIELRIITTHLVDTILQIEQTRNAYRQSLNSLYKEHQKIIDLRKSHLRILDLDQTAQRLIETWLTSYRQATNVTHKKSLEALLKSIGSKRPCHPQTYIERYVLQNGKSELSKKAARELQKMWTHKWKSMSRA